MMIHLIDKIGGAHGAEIQAQRAECSKFDISTSFEEMSSSICFDMAATDFGKTGSLCVALPSMRT